MEVARLALPPLKERLDQLELLSRQALTEKGKKIYLSELLRFVNAQVFGPNGIRGPVNLYGRLYYDRRRRNFVRRIRKNTFERISLSKVVSGYRMRDIERGLTRILLEQKLSQKKGKQR